MIVPPGRLDNDLYAFVTGLDVPSAEVTVVARAVKRLGDQGHRIFDCTIQASPE
jgi:hypothetical protein